MSPPTPTLLWEERGVCTPPSEMAVKPILQVGGQFVVTGPIKLAATTQVGIWVILFVQVPVLIGHHCAELTGRPVWWVALSWYWMKTLRDKDIKLAVSKVVPWLPMTNQTFLFSTWSPRTDSIGSCA